MAELLLELLSEEIPARLQSDAREQLAALLQSVIKEAGLPPARIETFATPRRLGLVARDIPIATEARDEERRGPRVEAPAAAYEGFLRGLGEAAYEIGQRDDKKGRVWIATIRHPGRQVRDILASSLPEALARFPWPKSMRWGDGDLRWVRPLQSILCLLDGEVVPFRLGAIEGGNATAGHRFMAPERLSVGGYDDYRERLRAAKVILDASERRSTHRDAGPTSSRREKACGCAAIRPFSTRSRVSSSGPCRCWAASIARSWSCRRRCWSPRCG